MTFAKEIEKWRPQLPWDELIIEVNKLYHSIEAGEYDQRHPEVHQQLPPLWKEMVAQALKLLPTGMHILDYGCGTGFEAQQVLENIPLNRIGSLVCYDPSPEMLSICRNKIQQLYPSALFFDELTNIPKEKKYNLLLTNSLLHHLPKPLEYIGAIEKDLDADCVWCAGHEPSKRFYKNEACLRLLAEYNRMRRLKKCFQPNEIFKQIRKLLGNEEGINAQTALESYRRNLFALQPPAQVIGLLVDCHVAHSSTEAEEGRGFSIDEMMRQLDGRWLLSWGKTYSFMGPFSETSLDQKWKNKSASLAEKFPDDGSNFCCVWKRCYGDQCCSVVKE